MAMTKIPGLGKSEGMQGGNFKPYTEGEYGLEITEVKLLPKDSGTTIQFNTTILEGPEQEDGKSPDGKKKVHFVFLMNDEHPKYEEYGHIGVDEIESMRIACGIDKKGDSIDLQSFVGEKLRCTMRVKEEKKEGPRKGQLVNTIYDWKSWK